MEPSKRFLIFTVMAVLSLFALNVVLAYVIPAFLQAT